MNTGKIFEYNVEEEYAKLTDDQLINLSLISSATGTKLTKEQTVFATSLKRPTISFSDAGTGKTHALAAGIVYLQKVNKVHGNKICVISFTREATREISKRYSNMINYNRVEQKANFGTLHKICFAIVKEALPRMKSTNSNNYYEDIPVLQKYCQELGIVDVTNEWLRRLLKAINTLNNGFIFDEEYMDLYYDFKNLGIPATAMNIIRRKFFLYQEVTGVIPQGDMPLHAYFAITAGDTVSKRYVNMFDVLIIDEFQDMSPLYLMLASKLSKVVSVIGDMKQQIYGFNGASETIVDDYFKLYPDAKVCPLTRSFRCHDEIVDKAAELIAPNKPAFNKGKGVGYGGNVQITKFKEINFDQIVAEASEHQDDIKNARDIMFLSRNNFSNILIMEKLFQANVRFRSAKFIRLTDLPMFAEMTKIIQSIEDPTDLYKAYDCLRLFDEFKYTSMESCGPIVVSKKTGVPWYQLDNYRWKDTYWTQICKLACSIEDELIIDEKTAGSLYSALMPVYEGYILKNRWWTVELPKEFYLSIAAPIVNTKTWSQFINDEEEKERLNKQNMANYLGIMCYTIHASKGLEADDVYMTDLDVGILPSAKNYDNYIQKKCYFEAAKMIRSERNLIYVGCTRARDNLYLCHNGELSSLIAKPGNNEFSYLDDILESFDISRYDNVRAFKELYAYKD